VSDYLESIAIGAEEPYQVPQRCLSCSSSVSRKTTFRMIQLSDDDYRIEIANQQLRPF
jgi:hypothetical protein